ncbi:hypothetical protein QBC36DRAFT_365480 [Triangularia setosa]|uniref:Uncharacterized protein n=1 Tax=Triangularia setosa TaxID=2587417 RepID=A0AAN6VXN5_9PEZI|nr:hypothetical protein QBC36DRAFT_365480 [Podospora setosa]
MTPRFSLPPETLVLAFPPPGQAAPAKTLPHIVLKDPKFPVCAPYQRQTMTARSTDPWVALVPFTADELQLSDQEAASVIQRTGLEDSGFQQSEVLNSILLPDGREDRDTFRYMAHVRQAAPRGVVSDDGNDARLYSVVVSYRLDPLERTEPTPAMVHLVSLEGVERLESKSLTNYDRVLLTSLYSWTYASLPLDSNDASTSLEHLRGGISVLQTSITSKQPNGDNKSLQAIIEMRQRNGYTLTRYCKELDFGMMDITYSSAWQLGRALAIADQSFIGALSRIRSLIRRGTVTKAKELDNSKSRADNSRDDTIAKMSDLVPGLGGLNTGIHVNKMPTTSTNRWKQRTRDPTTLRSPQDTTRLMSLAMDGAETDLDLPTSNTDYAVVERWVLDKLRLHGVSAHYLVPDSSCLLQEAVRLFYKDEKWTGALVDDALSLGNLDAGSNPKADRCRAALKAALKDLAKSRPEAGDCQQISKCSLILRSQILSKFPDLSVAVHFAETVKPNGPEKLVANTAILRQGKLTPDILLCIFDCVPADPLSLEFALPPHQQSFTIAESLSREGIQIAHMDIFRGRSTEPNKDPQRPVSVEKTYATNELLDWSSRTTKVEAYVKTVWDILAKQRGGVDNKDSFETSMTSALFALQLSETACSFWVKIPTA